MAAQEKNQFKVLGTVVDGNNVRLGNLLVKAFDRDLRSEQPLGECFTNADGAWVINYSAAKFSRAEKAGADIGVRVYTRDGATLLYEPTINDILFNAPAVAEINITVRTALPTKENEFDSIVRAITPLIEKVAIGELQENQQLPDITFLKNETGIEEQKLDYCVVAHRLGNESKMDPAFFYGLLRENTLLKFDITQALQVRFRIDINTDTVPLLYDVVLTDEKTIRRDITKAVQEMLIPAKVEKELTSIIRGLKQLQAKAQEYRNNEQPRKVLSLISGFVLNDKISEVQKLYAQSKNDLSKFFDTISSNEFIRSKTDANQAQLNLAIADVLGFDKNIIAGVQKIKNIRAPQDVKQLASLNKKEWRDILSTAGDAVDVGGKPLDPNLIDYHASSLVRKMEKRFPSVAFVAQLKREKKPTLKNHDAIAAFLQDHGEFDLKDTAIDPFIKKNNLHEKITGDVTRELKSVQRVFKLVPHYGKTKALLNANIHSAQSIVAAGRSRFVNDIAPKAGIAKKEAAAVFGKAEAVNTAAMHIVGELHDATSTMNIPALRLDGVSAALEAVTKDFPNLKSLFQLTDTCACEHCRSVYSPAAYLVELLQFLDKRSVIDITTVPPTTGHLAKDVLFERRPDLGDIDLSCENAETPAPYIDLVCELLEEIVAPDPGIAYNGVLSDGPDPQRGKISAALLAACTAAQFPITANALIFDTELSVPPPAILPPVIKYLRDEKAVCKLIDNGGGNWTVKLLHQTHGTAEELSAAPEYVNAAAYTTLAGSPYAFKLPFDANCAEAQAYFSRFGVSRSLVMSNFAKGGSPANESIAAEKLGLTDNDRKLIVTPDSLNQQLYWNTAPLSAVDEMKVVDHFLNKTGFTYKELEAFLQLTFINPDGRLYIKHLDMTCDTEQKEIFQLDDNALDRMHRFIRLQKKTGWRPDTLNEVIMQARLGSGALDNHCLVVMAALLALKEETGIALEQLVGFYGELPHAQPRGSALVPLYQTIFLNKAKNGFIDETLAPELIVGTELLAAYTTTLSVCLQLSEQDFAALTSSYAITTFGILPPDVPVAVPFGNLSLLFAAATLARKLKLKIDDFIVLKDLTGPDVFGSPGNTLDFVKHAVTGRTLPLKPADAQFMLSHQAVDLGAREISDAKINGILEGLQKSYQASFNANRSPYDDNATADELKEPVKNMLLKLPGMVEADGVAFMDIIDRNWIAQPAVNTFVDEKLDPFFAAATVTIVKNKINDLITAVGPDFEHERKALIKSLLASLSDYFYKKEKADALTKSMAASFKADEDLVTIVLRYARLRQPAPGTLLLYDALSSDSLIDTVTIPPAPPSINAIAFPDQYRSLRLLHKLLPLISALKLDTTAIEWLFEYSGLLGWFEMDKIPYQTGQIAIAYSVWEDFCTFASLMQKLTPVPNPADAEQPVTFFSVMELLLPGAPTTPAQWIDALSLITGYDSTQVTDIDGHFGFSVPDLSAYTQAQVWTQVDDCIGQLRLLGTSVARVKEFIKPLLTASDAEHLRLTLKARYDETVWLDTLKEIMDSIRPQKRDALVAYLLATNPSIKDETDLFDYLLVDTQMESCMPSSRIVQAHNTVQLFVQRCLMGLEPNAAADVSNDQSWDQWKWMKNYRVWEANRKVFLYPENWIQPELLDNKSFLLKNLENDLLQNDVNEVTAEDAITRYLEKLDDISFLEIVATFYQADIFTMHVFGRTKGGDPAIYYYRKFERERYWTPWEKVDLDITSDHLLAFVRNNRLNLAWPLFTEITNPNQKVVTPGVSSSPSAPQPMQKPEHKLKVQLAISEFANKTWKPKKVSKSGIMTPMDADPNNPTYTTDDIPRDTFKFFYNQFGDQIIVLDTIHGYQEIAGAFDLAGCKGYPELADPKPFFFNFIPVFKDTSLIFQRYNERNLDATDDLSVLNAAHFWSFLELLHQTPGDFRITYPHQFTVIDALALLYEILIINAGNSGTLSSAGYKERYLRIPLGTLLPYFFEDSRHAYVIIPGFYKQDRDPQTGEILYQQRTYSDLLQLIEDIIALFNKYLKKYQDDPAHDIVALLAALIADPEYQRIIAEIAVYAQLRYGEKFKNMYHPLVCMLRKTLYKDGIPALMSRDTQLFTDTTFDFNGNYAPNTAVIPQPFPIEDLDFDSDGSYSAYNWEMFYHVPMMLATRLSTDQKFEEAMVWYHYMFNPTGALPGDVPEKYWVTKPFYRTHIGDYVAQRIDTLLYKIADPTTPERKELEFAIDEWRSNPFMPHVVARFRPVAYQKALLMNYINTIIEWGDYMFRQDTMESVAQAIQLYVLADKLLGPKPRTIPPVVQQPYETYNQIEAKLDAFGNALIEFENILPDLTVLPHSGTELPPPPITLASLYFCIPDNDQMLAYWDRVADRLFKIRNCQNIDGVERSLALFAPPIDPGMLVRAGAAGMDIASILAGLNAPIPYYRFAILSQKATELTQEVRALGGLLLSALEKKDAEALSLLRSELEIKLLNAVRAMKQLQIDDAHEQIEILKKTKDVTTEKNTYYATIQPIIANEQLNLDKLSTAHDFQTAAQIVQAVGSVLSIIPDFSIGGHGAGGSPAVHATIGGTNLAHMTSAAATVLTIFSSMASYEASRAATLGGYDRRFSDWKLQERLSDKELKQIDEQITAANIRLEIFKTDLKNHDLQIENSQKTDEFMRSKFTNKDLYQWMIAQISGVYFRAYQLAYNTAKKAERSYQHELGTTDTFLQYGYWDSLKKGLQSADVLYHDIKRMETSYFDANKREYELTKHVSLALLDPLALVRLRATSACDFEIPEALFDMDHPGHYFRRIKTVSITLPCIAGPYTSVSAKLSLVNNKYRKNTAKAQGVSTPKEEYEEALGNDDRFVYNIGAIQSIAASSAQNDSGLFELNFRDDRYLPFEGTGAISAWRLELPKEVHQFDYGTISDVIIHIKYTAREGGSTLRTLAGTTLAAKLNEVKEQLNRHGLHCAFNMKYDMPNEWHLLKKNATVNLQITKGRLPYFAQALDAGIDRVTFIGKITGNPAGFTISIDGSNLILNRKDEWKLCLNDNTTIALDTPFVLAIAPLQLDKLEELMMVVKYTFAV